MISTSLKMEDLRLAVLCQQIAIVSNKKAIAGLISSLAALNLALRIDAGFGIGGFGRMFAKDNFLNALSTGSTAGTSFTG